MKKSVLVFCSLALAGITFWPVHTAPNALEWIVATNSRFNVLRIVMGLLLSTYAYMPKLQNTTMRLVLRALGVVVCLLAFYGMYYLSYSAYGPNMFPLDVASLLEAGIVAILASLTIPNETTYAHDGHNQPRNKRRLQILMRWLNN